MKTRIISDTGSVYWNMALDEALLEYAIKKGEAIIRLYTWKKPGITIGFFQRVNDVINIEEARRNGIEYTRRITGGGTVIHSDEYTYTVIMPAKNSIAKSYEEICGCIVKALRDLRINAIFQPINDIAVNGLKISGSAQTRRDGWLLQHGTLLLNTNRELMLKVLRIPREKIGKYGKRLVIGVEEIKNVNRNKLRELLIEKFSEELRLEINSEGIPLEVEEKTRKLEEKYKSSEWINMR
ncbi:lipoate--protein ligase family protein [Candidatus Woesearchaeota archaeon]|nr:lipoate--protein ligase family protein [Candidatus Woesearchaeota archaeon]